jgi:hypothetical protein
VPIVSPADPLALAGRVLHDARPASGGYSGETFTGLWQRQRAYVRLYLRNPERAVVDLAVLRLLDGKVPLPKVLAAVTDPPTSDRPMPVHVVTAAVPGQRGDQLLADSTATAAARAFGRGSARVVSVLRQHTFSAAGPFTDRRLTVGQWPEGYGTLVALAGHLRPRLVAAGVDAAPGTPLDAALAAADRRLASSAAQRPSLVHGDLNAKNMVVDPDTGRLRAVLDWEYAHSGGWLADVGNLLRGLGTADERPGDRAFREGVVESVHESLHAGRPARTDLEPDWVRHAHDTDLFALLDLAARSGAGGAPHKQARTLLIGLARTN